MSANVVDFRRAQDLRDRLPSGDRRRLKALLDFEAEAGALLRFVAAVIHSCGGMRNPACRRLMVNTVRELLRLSVSYERGGCRELGDVS